jgi:anti-sigma B factor antagonist
LTETPALDQPGLMLAVATSEPVPGTLRVTVTGEIDMSTRPAFDAEFGRAVAGAPRRLVADLTGVAFCGVTGMAALTRLRSRCADAGTELVIRPSSVVRLALDLAALSPLFRLAGPWATPEAAAGRSAAH